MNASQKKTAEALEMVKTHLRLGKLPDEKLAEWFGCDVKDAQAHFENHDQNMTEALTHAGLTYDEAFTAVVRGAR